MSPPQASPARKKILVLSSTGGGAHSAATSALEDYLDGLYEIEVAYYFRRIIAPNDPFHRLTGGRWNGEDVYNLFLRRGWHWIANHMCLSYATPRFITRTPELVERTRAFLEEERPDLVISVIPLINGIVGRAADELGIPFMILPVDMDTTNYINGLPIQYRDSFRYVLPFSDLEIRRRMAGAKVPRHQIRVLGFPVRRGFLQPPTREEARRQLELPLDKPVVMLLMGGAGAQSLKRFVKILSAMEEPMHLLLCAGRNAALERQLRKLELGDDTTSTVVGYTDQIPQMMAASDVLITKPGPATIAEALYSNLPMILDDTSRLLRWEEMNVQFVRNYGLGDVVSKHEEIAECVRRYLGDTEDGRRVRANLAAFPKRTFPERFRSLLAEVLPQEAVSTARATGQP